ncbi:MAG: Holliday junction resolvase RuvX [Actinomycetota bacterium]|nr:Holliday junction resolvase RuvX [Actinomycetota bacterium]
MSSRHGSFRRGARLGVDVGDVRIGVAVSDPDGVLATPVETVAAGARALGHLAALAGEHEVIEVVLGLPRSLSGSDGPAAAKARAFGARLADQVAPIPVRLVDERMSTVSAQRSLRDASLGNRGLGNRGLVNRGLGNRGRTGAKRREVVDQAAAVIILQTALDAERTSGAAPGEIVAGQAAAPPAVQHRDREVW